MPNYPVLIGAGQLTNHPKVIDEAIEPLEMMERVARDAEKDTRLTGLLAKLDSVQVVNMLSWSYADAPGMLAARVGAEPTQTVYSPIGGETPQRLINETAQAIAEGSAARRSASMARTAPASRRPRLATAPRRQRASTRSSRTPSGRISAVP